MKTIFMVLLLGIIVELRAQTIYYDNEAKTYGSSYNPSTGTFTPMVGSPVLSRGSSVSYWLVNVNPFAEKVQINGRKISLTTNMPTQLATLFSIEVEAEKALADTQNQVDKMESVNRSTAIAPALKAKTEQLVKDCNTYYQEAKRSKKRWPCTHD